MNTVDHATITPVTLSPRRRAAALWRWLAVAGVVTAIVCAGAMMWVDDPLALYMHGFAQTRMVAGFAMITNLANSAIWYSLALAGMAWALIDARRRPTPQTGALLRKRLRAGSFLIVSMVASGILINGIKVLVGRDRPKELFTDGVATFHPLARTIAECSFPSGHAQSIWGAMIALAWIFPPLRVACFVVAVLVSASRVIIGAHFLSDVIGGAFFAIAVALLIRKVFERDGITLDLSTPPDKHEPALE